MEIVQSFEKVPVEEVITITELRNRLKISKEATYNLISEPGCPLYNLGGPRQNRVIWGEFLEWFKKRKRAS